MSVASTSLLALPPKISALTVAIRLSHASVDIFPDSGARETRLCFGTRSSLLPFVGLRHSLNLESNKTVTCFLSCLGQAVNSSSRIIIQMSIVFFPACMRLSRLSRQLSWTPGPSTCVVMQPGEFTVLGIYYIVLSPLETNNSKVLRQGVGRLSHGRRTRRRNNCSCGAMKWSPFEMKLLSSRLLHPCQSSCGEPRGG